MNKLHREALDDLKASIDSVFAETLVWITAEGKQQSVEGIFNRLATQFVAKPINKKRESSTTVDFVAATLSLAPHLAGMKVEDIIIHDGISFRVLPFNQGEFETVIPLKLISEKDPSWR